MRIPVSSENQRPSLNFHSLLQLQIARAWLFGLQTLHYTHTNTKGALHKQRLKVSTPIGSQRMVGCTPHLRGNDKHGCIVNNTQHCMISSAGNVFLPQHNATERTSRNPPHGNGLTKDGETDATFTLSHFSCAGLNMALPMNRKLITHAAKDRFRNVLRYTYS